MHFNCGDCAKRLAQQLRTLHNSPPRVQRSSGHIPTAFNTSTVSKVFDYHCKHLRPVHFAWCNAVLNQSFWTLSAGTPRYLAHIKRVTLKIGLTDGFFLAHVSQYPCRFQQLPAPPVETSGIAEAAAPLIAPEALDMLSSGIGRKLSQPIRFSDFGTVFI